MYNPDYSEAFDSPVPGSYRVMVSGWEEKTSQKGAKYLSWKLTIKDHAKYTGAVLFHRTMLSGKGAGILKSFLRSADTSYNDGGFDPQSFVNKELVVTIKQGTMQDGSPSKYPEVVSVAPLQQAQAPQAAQSQQHTAEDPFL